MSHNAKGKAMTGKKSMRRKVWELEKAIGERKQAILSKFHDPKMAALASVLNLQQPTDSELSELDAGECPSALFDVSPSACGDDVYDADGGEYRVLTDGEADEATVEDIRDSLWAFNASFLVDYLPDGVGEEIIEALRPQCEGANEAILSMVGNRFNDLVKGAIAADGRGHFLSGYDGEEREAKIGDEYYYIYRIN